MMLVAMINLTSMSSRRWQCCISRTRSDQINWTKSIGLLNYVFLPCFLPSEPRGAKQKRHVNAFKRYLRVQCAGNKKNIEI